MEEGFSLLPWEITSICPWTSSGAPNQGAGTLFFFFIKWVCGCVCRWSRREAGRVSEEEAEEVVPAILSTLRQQSD